VNEYNPKPTKKVVISSFF